jgi:hypothetical protein
VVTIDNDSVTLGRIRGHKFALRAMRKGKTSLSMVADWHALADIAPEHIHATIRAPI